MDTGPDNGMDLGTGRGSGGKSAIVVLVLIAGGAGFAAWQMYGQSKQAAMQRDKAVAEQRANGDAFDQVKKSESKLAECTIGLEAEKATRAQTEKLASDLDATKAELEELRKEHAENEKTVAAFKAIGDKLRKMIDAGKIQVTIRSGRMIVKLPAEVLFASGSADLSKDGQTHLAEVAGALKQFPERKFMISGHTDNIPVGDKRFKDNWDLSTARALTVLQHLVSKGMRPNRLVAAGHGEFEPLYTNSTEAGRRENRRIEIVLMPSTAELPKIPPAPAASAKAK
jgi:chemotaxis protein MotB